jgi:hypothetical protein
MTLPSLPQCHAALSMIPSNLAWVDQSPVSQRVVATLIRVYHRSYMVAEGTDCVVMDWRLHSRKAYLLIGSVLTRFGSCLPFEDATFASGDKHSKK